MRISQGRITLARVGRIVATRQGTSSLWSSANLSATQRPHLNALNPECSYIVTRVRASTTRAGHVYFSRGPIARKKASLWAIGRSVSHHTLDSYVIVNGSQHQILPSADLRNSAILTSCASPNLRGDAHASFLSRCGAMSSAAPLHSMVWLILA